MINYKLAKKLKDIGFSQKYGEVGKFIYPDETIVAVHLKEDESCYIPTLSELIEACADRFYDLVREKENKVWWEASDPMNEFFTQGDTPEEAVANLYLKLHGKE